MRHRNIIFKGLVYLLFNLNTLEGSPPKWIDIPNDNYETIAQLNHPYLRKLNVIVEKYHSISKSNSNDIEMRSHELENVINFINECLANDLSHKLNCFFKNILDIAKNKHEHLLELIVIYHEKQTSQKYLEDYHLDISKLKGNYHPIFLCNHRMYDSFNGQYWGEYWMETVDPCHRQLTPYYELFKRNHGFEPNLFDFFLWLEEQNLSKDVPYLRFLDDNELKNATVSVVNGLLYLNINSKEILINYFDPKTEYIFNIDLDEQLMIVPATKLMHHVSLSRGKPVLGCGNMVIKNGIIDSIELESGHYLPTIENGIQVLEILKSKEILLSPSTSFFYYDEGKKQQSTVARFLNLFSS